MTARCRSQVNTAYSPCRSKMRQRQPSLAQIQTSSLACAPDTPSQHRLAGQCEPLPTQRSDPSWPAARTCAAGAAPQGHAPCARAGTPNHRPAPGAGDLGCSPAACGSSNLPGIAAQQHGSRASYRHSSGTVALRMPISIRLSTSHDSTPVQPCLQAFATRTGSSCERACHEACERCAALVQVAAARWPPGSLSQHRARRGGPSMRRRPRPRACDNINVTPLMDLAWVLLIIVSSSWPTAALQGISVSLLRASAVPSLSQPHAARASGYHPRPTSAWSRSAWFELAGEIQSHLQKHLGRVESLRRLRARASRAGVLAVQVVGSSGDPRLDAQLASALERLPPMKSSPPPGMPWPVQLQLVSHTRLAGDGQPRRSHARRWPAVASPRAAEPPRDHCADHQCDQDDDHGHAAVLADLGERACGALAGEPVAQRRKQRHAPGHGCHDGGPRLEQHHQGDKAQRERRRVTKLATVAWKASRSARRSDCWYTCTPRESVRLAAHDRSPVHAGHVQPGDHAHAGDDGGCATEADVAQRARCALLGAGAVGRRLLDLRPHHGRGRHLKVPLDVHCEICIAKARWPLLPPPG